MPSKSASQKLKFKIEENGAKKRLKLIKNCSTRDTEGEKPVVRISKAISTKNRYISYKQPPAGPAENIPRVK